jgi:hypothetical protein
MNGENCHISKNVMVHWSNGPGPGLLVNDMNVMYMYVIYFWNIV